MKKKILNKNSIKFTLKIYPTYGRFYINQKGSKKIIEEWGLKNQKHISKYIADGSVDPFYILNTSALMKDPKPVIRGLEIFTGLKWPKDVKYESVIRDPDINRHNLLLNEGFHCDRAAHKSYFKNRKPLVIR